MVVQSQTFSPSRMTARGWSAARLSWTGSTWPSTSAMVSWSRADWQFEAAATRRPRPFWLSGRLYACRSKAYWVPCYWGSEPSRNNLYMPGLIKLSRPAIITPLLFTFAAPRELYNLPLPQYPQVQDLFHRHMTRSLLAFVLLLSVGSCTLYSVLPNYTVIYERHPSELAHATYDNTVYEKGWNFLRIYASAQVGLLDQHRGAGFLEGYASYRDIYSAYRNLCGALLEGEQLPTLTQDFVDEQLEYIEDMIASHPRDIYWQYAQAYLEQLRYMYRGYLTRINIEKALNMYMGFSQFYYLTNIGDLEDLIPAFKQQSADTKQYGNCNGIVKMINGELYIGHSTHNIYQFLLRTYKTYHFPSRNTQVGSQWLSFSSRPGDLISKDDFYVLGSGLIVMETSFANYNKDNYLSLSPRTVPCWLRQTIAANLARNGAEWVNYFLKERSGTHNNQWVVVDPAKVKNLREIVTLVEEAFSIFEVVDATPLLLQKGYVASYNVPFTKQVYHQLGYENYPYTYDDDPRAYEYAKYNQLINNVDDMKKWLLTNENEDPTVGIAPRYDLAKNPSAFGLTDLKIVSAETIRNNYAWAYAGPTTSNGKYQPFDWTNWPSVAHQGMPKKWNFTFEKYIFVDPELTAQPSGSARGKLSLQQN